MRWTGHCCRAGWASEWWLGGRTLDQLQTGGRLTSIDSVCTYVDAISMGATMDAKMSNDQPNAAEFVQLRMEEFFVELPYRLRWRE